MSKKQEISRFFFSLTFYFQFSSQAGGNRNAREFFEDQPDWNDTMSINQKYNTQAAALYRDKIATIAQGKTWNQSQSTATKNFSLNNSGGSSSQHSNNSSLSHSRSSGSIQNNRSTSYQDGNGGGGYQDGGGGGNGGGYQNFNTQEFKDQKEAFFSTKQQENLMRPE